MAFIILGFDLDFFASLINFLRISFLNLFILVLFLSFLNFLMADFSIGIRRVYHVILLKTRCSLLSF